MTDTPVPSRPRQRRKTSGDPDQPMVAPFELRGSGALNGLRVRRRRVRVELSDGILRITPRPGDERAYPVATMRHILAGKTPHRSATAHRLEIWPEQGRSIILTAFAGHPEMPGYAAMLRGLAVEAERSGKAGLIRHGLPRRYVFGLPLLIFVCLYGAIWFAAHDGGAGPTTLQEHLLMALGIGALALIPTAWTLRQGFHREIRTAADLDRLLRPR